MTTTITDLISLYEDNAGLLHMHLHGDDKVICSLPETPGGFEQDARLYGEWAHEWASDGNITCTLAEFFEDANPTGYAIGERTSDMVHVANYRDGKIEIIGCMGRAAQMYVTGKYSE